MASARVVGYSVVAGCVVLGLAAASRFMAREARSASQFVPALASSPPSDSDAIVRVYAARASGWHGIFGVHTWVAVRPAEATEYTIYEVIGWRVRYGSPAVVIHSRIPDAKWFGAKAELIAEQRGPQAAELIAQIDNAAQTYPWSNRYRIWPGPNSNTFVAWIARAVPGIGVDLPSTAIGKDYLGSSVIAIAPSGRGVQFSLFGLIGLIASPLEGLEINMLGLTFGLNPYRWTLKLPIVGILAFGRSLPALSDGALQPALIPAALAKPSSEL